MVAKRFIDWDAIERDYRAGVKTLREMSADHHVSHVSIDRHAKKREWTRDLSAKIKLKADELVNKSRANKELTETAIVKSAAELQAGAILQESAEIKRLSRIAKSFESELELMNSEDSDDKTELEKRTRILKALTEIREKIINLRRRNLRINDNSLGAADSPAESIAEIIRLATGNVLRPNE